MINDFLKWLARTLLSMVCWIFVLSIHVNGRTIYSHGYDILVDNALVRTLDRELAEIWQIATKTAKGTMATVSEKRDEG